MNTQMQIPSGFNTFSHTLAIGKKITILRAYHIEEGDTFEDSKKMGLPSLCKDSLVDMKPLYLCSNPDEWFPKHLSEFKNGKVFEIDISLENLNILKYTTWDDWCGLAYFDTDLLGTIYPPRLIENINNGIDFYYLDRDNDRKELSEAFLINSSKHVVSIRDITNELNIKP